MTQAPGREGVRVFPPPPKGFDPFTATKADLARHGLPSRPDRETQSVQAALWEHIANRYASFEHLQPNLSYPDTPTTPATTEAGIALFALDRFSSCGYQVFRPDPAAPFLSTSATWTVPNLKYKTDPHGPNPNRFHTFLGLGFLDVHVNMTVDAAQNVTAAFAIHTGAVVGLPVSPGDVVSAVLCSPGEPEGPNQSPSAYFLANETTSQTVNFQIVTGFPPALEINAGVSRTLDAPNRPLAGFGAVYFDDITTDGTRVLPDGQSTTMIEFPDPPGNTLARPVKLNDRAFKIVYEGD
jgi:hypothetical protein